MKKFILYIIVLTSFSCVSVQKKLQKNPDGNFSQRKENREWKKVVNSYRRKMSDESKKVWSSVEVITD